MTPEELKPITESLIFAAGNPISLRRLAEVIGVTQADIKPALALLRQEYEAAGRGIIFAEVAGGYQLRTAPDHAEYIKVLLQERPSKLSRAALETLAIIAYRQPITKIEIESVRGVAVDGVLNSLLTKKLIREMGRKDVPGRPWVYGTTPHFLELFGLHDLESLPPLPDIHEPTLNPLLETDAEDGVPHQNGEAPPTETLETSAQSLEATEQNDQNIPQDSTSDTTLDDTPDQAVQADSQEASLSGSPSEQSNESVQDEIEAANPSRSDPIEAAPEPNGEAASSRTPEQTLGASGDSLQESGRPSDPSRESPGEWPDDHPTGDDGGPET